MPRTRRCAAVVAAVEALVRQDSAVRQIRASVQVNNPAALRFWVRQGYAPCGPTQLQEDGTTTYPLCKPL